MGLDPAAAADQRGFYDARYRAGYMRDFSDFFEACRVRTVREVLRRVEIKVDSALDYGCGEGRYLDLLADVFPGARLYGSDVSAVGVGLARERRPDAVVFEMVDETVPTAERFDVVLSIEVLEHVANVRAAVHELARLTRPGGKLLVTTPSANRWSIEWLVMRLTGGLQSSPDGYQRFRSDEPGHLRRLTSSELELLLTEAGFDVDGAWFRGQLFAYPIASKYAGRLLPAKVRVQLGMLDWKLFRRLSNGSTMLMLATRRSG